MSTTAARARAVLPRAGAAAGSAAARSRSALWRVGLAAVTAGVAYTLGQHLLGMPAPIFASIAAIVILAADPAMRGRRGLRLIVGVVTGVAVGEVLASWLGSGAWQVGLAAAAAMLIASTFSLNPLPIIQAGVAALLVVALHSAQSGFTRLFSALIGGALALLISQVLVSPSPVGLLAGAAQDALRAPAGGLRALGRALGGDDRRAADEAVTLLRDGHGELAAFVDARQASREVARSTVRGRRDARERARLDERLGGVEYLYAACVLLAHTAHGVVTSNLQVPTWLRQASTTSRRRSRYSPRTYAPNRPAGEPTNSLPG